MDDTHEHQRFGSDHFDQRAASWDDNPEHVRRAVAIAEAIRAEVPLDASTRVLEYGAGTGLVSEALRDHVGTLTLADPSLGMREVVQSKIDAGTLPGARVWDLDLAVGSAPAGERFDVVVTVMTLHHITDLTPVLVGFAELLEPGGYLCVADLEQEDGSFHGDDFHGHRGFARDSLTAALVASGFSEPRFSTPYRIERDGTAYPVFLAVSSLSDGASLAT
jgi:predicted TPR repeat methyltransferase